MFKDVKTTFSTTRSSEYAWWALSDASRWSKEMAPLTDFDMNNWG